MDWKDKKNTQTSTFINRYWIIEWNVWKGFFDAFVSLWFVTEFIEVLSKLSSLLQVINV